MQEHPPGGMDHSQHAEHMAGMDHSQHMEHMAGMDHKQQMEHKRHMDHMAGKGDMDHAEHMRHMAGAGGMDHSGHQDHHTAGMDHSDHTENSAGTINDLTGTVMSTGGLFKASVKSDLNPVPVNQIHSWTLHVEAADGRPVDGADISVDGGMPAHNHGLPTAPQVTRALGNGDYLVEGMMFHMAGHWQVSFNIDAGGRSDEVIFNFILE
jgi:hypothetical protein